MSLNQLQREVSSQERQNVAGTPSQTVVLSFDVEEHYRIEAATGLTIDSGVVARSLERLVPATRWLLDELDRLSIKATFFIVGQIARTCPEIIRAIHRAGHEVASHGWDHRRVITMTPDQFREDVRRSKDALEQVVGEEVIGYRAPTFSILRQTAWAIDVLAEEGFRYDSSIVPAHHDRYGIPDAPRAPFLARGQGHDLLELPPATFRWLATNLPIGGGGYFRLLPLPFLEHALRQLQRDCRPSIAMLYFHPWEFDPQQERLPLGRLNRLRTYVGIGRSRDRLVRLLGRHRFARARDVVQKLDELRSDLPVFSPSGRS